MRWERTEGGGRGVGGGKEDEVDEGGRGGGGILGGRKWAKWGKLG